MSVITEENKIEEFKLSNGLRILMLANLTAPVATFLVLYKVGSRNEAVGHTGATHLLEHLLFKGTPTFNKDNNSQIAAMLQRVGADFNATTWYDRTNYFETVPSDQLELAVKIEADRMRNSFIADSDRRSEMTVVRNELERGQNEPVEVLEEAVYAAAIREHPYHHPTIGWRSDVEGVPTSRLKLFYDTFYHPNNATVIVVGNFDQVRTLDIINNYFGRYPASPTPIPEVYTTEPPQEGERRLVVRRAGELALVQIAFRTPAALGQNAVLSNQELVKRAANAPVDIDTYPLVVLSALLTNGVTSRLYQSLVEKQLAVDVNSWADQHRDPGLFNVVVTVQPGIELERVERLILEEIERIKTEDPRDEEVERSIRQIVAHEAYESDGTQNLALHISEAEAIADWRYFENYVSNIGRVEPKDIRRVALDYFNQDSMTVGCFIPRSESATTVVRRTIRNDSAARSLSDLQKRGCFFRRPDNPNVSMHRGDSKADRKLLRSSASHSLHSKHSAPGSNDRAFSKRIVRHTTAGEATLLLLENHASSTVAIRGSLRAGSHFEPDGKPGLARITAEMLTRGSNRRTKIEIAGALEGAGAEMDFSADPFTANIAGRALSEDLPLVLEVLAEVLLEPSFPDDELEKVKQQTIAAIQEEQASTTYRAYEKFCSLIFEETNPYYMHPSDKLIESIGSFTVEDVRQFHRERYGGRSLILTVVGDIRSREVEEKFSELFETFSGPESVEVDVLDPTPQTGELREFVLVKDKANVDILLGSSTELRRDSQDFYAAHLANLALGESTLSSRLGLQVRDKEGLTYGINSRFRAPSLAAGPWVIGVSVNPENVERAIESAIAIVRDYVENGVRPDELADQKSSAIGSFRVSLSTNSGLANSLWYAEFYSLGIEYLDRYPELIERVTVEEVNAAIRKYFRPDHLTIVVAGDTSSSTVAPMPVG